MEIATSSGYLAGAFASTVLTLLNCLRCYCCCLHCYSGLLMMPLDYWRLSSLCQLVLCYLMNCCCCCKRAVLGCCLSGGVDLGYGPGDDAAAAVAVGIGFLKQLQLIVEREVGYCLPMGLNCSI